MVVSSVRFHSRCVKLTKRQIEAMDEPWFGSCCSTSSAAANQPEPESFSFNREGAVIKRVPKAFRIQAAKLLTEILQKVVMENSLAAWQRLFNFARSCFMKPKRAGKKSKFLASVVNRQIKDFAEIDIVPLGNSLVNKKRKHSCSSKAFDISSFVSSKLALGDVKGTERVLSSDSKVLESSLEVINQGRHTQTMSKYLSVKYLLISKKSRTLA